MTRLTTQLPRLAIAALLALSLVAALPVAAIAAPGVPLERVDLQLEPGSGANPGILIITGTLPDSATLPATIRLSVPQGMTIRWSGEVLGGDLADDPTLDPNIEHGENGYDIANLTLTKGRRGQLELDAVGTVVQDGASRAIRLAWAPVEPVGTVGLTTAIPAGSTIETMTAGATTGPGPSNGTLISLDTSVPPGAEAVLAVRYAAPAVPAGGATSSQGSNAPLIIIFGALAALFVFAGIAISKRTRTAVTRDDDEPEIDEEPAEETESTSAKTDDAAITLEAEESVADAADHPSPPGRKFSPQLIIILVVAAMLGGTALTMVSGETPGTTKTTNEYAYKVLTDAKADATFTSPIVLSEADPAHEATHVFDSVAAVPGVRSVRLIFAGPSVEIEYASSQLDEAAIRAALTASGYVR